MSSFSSRAPRVPLLGLLGALALPVGVHAIIDRDGNLQSDIWQLHYATGNLAATADTDGDGVTNLDESVAGTDPRSSLSHPALFLAHASGQVRVRWASPGDKRYEVFTASTLGAAAIWTGNGAVTGSGDLSATFPLTGNAAKFFRLQIDDLDTDGDGLADWEERQIGWDPTRRNTEGFGSTTTTDFARLNSALALLTDTSATNDNVVTVVAYDPEMAENWPDPGVIALRRTGSVNAITVNYTIGGTATRDSDYRGPASGSVVFGLGVDEVRLSFSPIADSASESAETIVVTLQPGTGYSIGTALAGAPAANVSTLTLANANATGVSYEEASRFLAQATFGPVESELARVQQLGFSGWIDEQFARTAQKHFPLVQQWQDEIVAFNPAVTASSNERTEVWWRRALQADAASDPLRQRVAHALSQICVISDRVETLGNTPRGMAAYHDQLLEHAFGNYRGLIKAVSLHPTMGIYLSHLRNQKANLSRNTYPDENYAREVMQLFSIGLWELNADGTRKLDAEGQPIPTYDNTTIANFARVFTGLSYGKKFTSSTNLTIIPTTGFFDGNALAWEPMRGFDAYHDLAAKTLLNGQTLPARTASSPDTGAATMADIDAAMDNLTNHPNTGPFIARLLIQRLITSNPTPAYIGRVSAAFANNGAGVRGDMKAVVKAILLDPDARSPALLAEPDQGLQREPYLRFVALARALGKPPSDGRYRGFRGIDGEFLQRPYSSPSVFNFYSPDYQPLGPIKNAGLVGPEFQITNGVTGLTSPNRFYDQISNNSTLRLNPGGANNLDGTANAAFNTVIDTAPWLADATTNPEALVARLDRLFVGGQLSPASLRIINRAVRRLSDPLGTTDPTTRTTRATDRLRMAIYLVTISPEFCVLK